MKRTKPCFSAIWPRLWMCHPVRGYSVVQIVHRATRERLGVVGKCFRCEEGWGREEQCVALSDEKEAVDDTHRAHTDTHTRSRIRPCTACI